MGLNEIRVSAFIYSVSQKGQCLIVSGAQVRVTEALTSVLTTRFDDFGPTFTCVLHSLGHAFPGHLVGVIRGTHCDLVLYCCQQCQM